MKYYITSPETDINNLCASMLDEDSFHQGLTLVDSEEKKKAVVGWEVTLEQLRAIHRSAQRKGIPLKRFVVAKHRSERSETLIVVKEEEYNPGYQTRNQRPARLKEILRDRGLR